MRATILMDTHPPLILVAGLPAELSQSLQHCLGEGGYRVATQPRLPAAWDTCNPPPTLLLSADAEAIAALYQQTYGPATPRPALLLLGQHPPHAEFLALLAQVEVDWLHLPLDCGELGWRVQRLLNLAAQRHTLQQELHHHQQQNAYFSHFARTLAHDLKNPLSAITVLSDLLLDTCASQTTLDSAAIVDELQMIAQGGHQLGNIVDFLQVAAAVAGSEPIETEILDMDGLVYEVVSQRVVHLIEERNAELELPETWHLALGYSPWVSMLWVNHLTTLLRYGGRPPRLEFGSTLEADGMVRFWVKDHNAHWQENPFQGEGSASERHNLRLNLAYQIVEKLGGYSGVEIEANGVGGFYFCLPAMRED